MKSLPWIKTVYLYIATIIGLVVAIVGYVGLVNTAVKLMVFKDYPVGDYQIAPQSVQTPDGKVVAETQSERDARIAELRKERKVNDLTTSISMSVLGTALYVYHWRLARKES